MAILNNKLNKNKPSLKPVDMQDKLDKLERQKIRKEEDMKLKELEKYDVKFKRNKSSAKVKTIPNIQLTEDPHKRLMDNILSNASNTNSNSNFTNLTNLTNLTVANNKINTNSITNSIKISNVDIKDNLKLDKSIQDDSDFRKSKTTMKKEKIEINCENNITISTSVKNNDNKINPPSKKTNSNKAMDILKNDLEKNELDNSNILSKSLFGDFDDTNFNEVVNEDKYNNLFGNNLCEEYYEVYNFLESINLHKKYFNTFIQHEFLDMQAIFLIEEKHLDEMKIKGGSKAKILNKVKEMKTSSKKLLEEMYNNNTGGNPESGVGTEDLKSNVSKNQDFYDEEEQRRLFQEAVQEFRTGSTKPKNDFNSSLTNFNKQMEKDDKKKKDKVDEYQKKEKEKLIQSSLNTIKEEDEDKDKDKYGYNVENTQGDKVQAVPVQPKKSILYSLGESNFLFENNMPFGESGTDPMSTPLGEKISCWNCYKVIKKDKVIEDKIIYGKVIFII